MVPLNTAGAGTVTFMNLVDKPWGKPACEYEAAFESRQASTAAGIQLNRTSSSPVAFDGASNRAGTAVAGAYEAVSSAILTLRNTTTADPTRLLGDQLEVEVSFAASGSACSETAAAETIDAAGTENVGLGEDVCVWTLTFANLTDDCLVTAKVRGTGSDPATNVLETVTATAVTGSTLQLNVDASRAVLQGASGADEVSSVDFEVQTGSCATVFAATVSVNVTDTANPTDLSGHENSMIKVTIVRQGTDSQCVVHGVDQNNQVTLLLGSDGRATSQPILVDQPYSPSGTAASCEYDVTFPSPVDSAESGTNLLRQGDAAGELSAGAGAGASSRSVSRVYDAERPARITLENATTATTLSAPRNTVSVTLTPSACGSGVTEPDVITRTLGAPGTANASVSVSLGMLSCTWTVAYQNPDMDCEVSHELEQGTGGSATMIAGSSDTADDGDGSLTFKVRNRRPLFDDGSDSDQSNDPVISKAKFAVGSECTTFFDGELKVEVTDTNNGDHAGTDFPVTVAPVTANAGCTAADDAKVTGLEVPLTMMRSGSLDVTGLVDVPLDGNKCSYTVTFTSPKVVSDKDSTISLERQGASNGVFTIEAADPADATDMSNVAAIEYDAVRTATVRLVNKTTTSMHTHADDAHRRDVVVTLTSSACQNTGDPEVVADQTLTVGADTPVQLGTDDCTWTVTFRNTRSDCEVSAQPRKLAGETQADPAADTDGTLVLYTVGRRVRATAQASSVELGSIEFTVPDTPASKCTTHFTASFPVTVTDTSADATKRDHTGSTIDITLARQGSDTRCIATHIQTGTEVSQTTATLTSALAGSGSVRLVNVPLGGSACNYTASFPKTADSTQSGIDLERKASTDATATVNAGSASVSLAYDAVRAATIKLVNRTTDQMHTHAHDTHRRTVTVELASSSCSGSGTPAAGSTRTLMVAAQPLTLSLGTQDCTWTLTYRNTRSDCQVSALPKKLAGESGADPAADTDGSLVIHTVGRRARIADRSDATQLDTIEFTVPEANCTTHFTASFPVTVTDTSADATKRDHTGSTIDITLARQGSDTRCIATHIQTGVEVSQTTATLTSALRGTGSVRLVNVPLGGSACAYTASFPKTADSTQSGIELERKAATAATATVRAATSQNANANVAAAEYDAVRAAPLTLRNATTASHTPAERSEVLVSRNSSSSCVVTPAADPVTLTTSSRSQDVTLGTVVCTLVLDFRNTDADCAVVAQFRDADGGAVGSAVTATRGTGSVTLHVNAQRRTMSAASGGSEVATVEFNVPADSCTTYFTAMFPITVTDTRNGDHTNSPVDIGLVALGSDSRCVRVEVPQGAVAGTVAVKLNAALSGSGSARLVDVPVGGSPCSYRVSFPATAVSVVPGISLELAADTVNPATVRAATSQNANANVAAAEYDAVRAAEVSVRNATAAGSAHDPATRRVVKLMPSTTCAAATHKAAFDLPVASSATPVTLGKVACTWTVAFANTADDCVVEAQLKDTSGGVIGSAVSNRPAASTVTLHVNDNRRVLSSAGSDAVEVGSVEFTVLADCDTSFDGTVSVSVSDALERDVSDGNHAGTGVTVTVSPAGANAGRCSRSASETMQLSSGNAARFMFSGLINVPAGMKSPVTPCVYSVSFSSSVNSATNFRVRLVNTNQGEVELRGTPTSAASVTLTYRVELIPEPPAARNVTVSSAAPVSEGEPLVFTVGLPGPASAAVEITYSVAGGTAAQSTAGSVTINAGQSSTVISVPTTDDELDEADQTVRVTLTGVTGGVAIDQFGRTATGIVRDNDPAPTVGISQASLTANQVRFTVELDVPSGRDVTVSYTTSLGTSGRALITAGDTRKQVEHVVDRALLAGRTSLRLRLTSVQNATIDPAARERLLLPGGEEWQFHTTSRAGVTPAQIAAAFALADGWKLYSWNAATQRWVEHTARSGANTRLAAGVAITFKGAQPDTEQVAEAGLGRSEQVTLRQGWNIFTPDPDAIGTTSANFTRVAGGASAVLFDPMLVNCDREALAGVLVIYTYDQSDPQAANGFRIALPCHPDVQAEAGIPAITSIDANDTIYAWFHSTTPVTLQYANGRYSPA